MIALLAPLPLPSPPPLASLAQAPAPVIPSYVACPANLTARYGGVLGWSSIPVQANFAAAVIDPGKGLMTCQYLITHKAPQTSGPSPGKAYTSRLHWRSVPSLPPS